MLRNHYLFSSQFRRYLQTQELEDEEFFAGFRATVSSFLRHADQRDLDALTQQAVGPILTQLQFAAPPFTSADFGVPARCGYLYDGFPLQNNVSAVYIVSPIEGGQGGVSSPLEGGQGWVLDMAEKGHFPAFDLIHLLKQENLEWGILTNGLVWRLYSTLSPQPYEQYLEIDFSDAGEEEFRVFWQLFSLALFLPNEQGVTPLETYIEESAREAQVIEKHIKSNIEEILENICFGLLSFAGKDAQPLSEADKQRYFENAVYLLFRLLFIFYAESRELLPLKNPNYRQHSLEALLGQARAWMQSGVVNPEGTELWDGFRDLCLKIEYGDPALGIPEYDGGLFDSQLHGFLSDAQHKVKNLYFVKVLYLLGYRKAGKKQKTGVQSVLCDHPIDYRDLSVRSLGTLYEGILEYKLFIASEDLVLRKKKIVPVREAGKVKKSERVIEAGRVYFAQAANERHDSGSYYTPEYVVDYMVKHSVRAGLEERWQAFQPTLERYDRELRQAASEDLRTALLKKLDQELLQFVDEQVLSFKVVDPAMGSGHFLVNALNTITHFILEALQLKVQFTIDHSPFTIDHSHIRRNPALDLTPARWRRKAAERCIFGVDINPLAVELAKLSLWIASADAGKPLTFLNHHLKSGDSILGIRLEDMLSYPERKPTPGPSQEGKTKQTTIWDLLDKEQISAIKEQFQRFLKRDSDQIEQILSKKDAYEEITQNAVLNHLKDMATLWLLIGLDVNSKKSRDLFEAAPRYPDETRYFKLLQEAQRVQSESEWQKMLGAQVYADIKDYQQKYRLCHWELEFPEIINEKFDVTVGNPPYGAILKEKDFLKIRFIKTSYGNIDSYKYFIQIGTELLNQSGKLSFITSSSYLAKKHFKDIRIFLAQNFSFIRNIKLGDNIFAEANLPTAIFVGKKNSEKKFEYLDLSKTKDYNIRLNRLLGENDFNSVKPDIKEGFEITTSIIKFEECKNLAEIFDQVMGVKVYQIGKGKPKQTQYEIENNSFISNEKKDENYLPFISKGIKRYFFMGTEEFIKYGKWLAEPRQKKYFIQPKIVIREIINPRIFATYIDYDAVVKNTNAVIIEKTKNYSLKYLLALINSKLFTYYIFEQSPKSTNKSYPSFTSQLIKKLPIKDISREFQKPFIKFTDEILNLTQSSDYLENPQKQREVKKLDEQIDRMVYALYDLTEEEIALVEGKENCEW